MNIIITCQMMAMNFIEKIMRIFFVDTRAKNFQLTIVDSISISFAICKRVNRILKILKSNINNFNGVIIFSEGKVLKFFLVIINKIKFQYFHKKWYFKIKMIKYRDNYE